MTTEERINRLEEEIMRLKRGKGRPQTMSCLLGKEFAPDFHAFDYVDTWEAHCPDGSIARSSTEKIMGERVKSAIFTLLQAIYQVDHSRKLPEEKEPEIREFITAVLALMNERRGQEGGDKG